MARGFKHGGGSINPLNFQVVAGTAMPAKPEEYTIYIETDVPMSRWVFAGVDPGPIDEGMVWIVTGSSSAADFHAIGSGGILLVSPIQVFQYINGERVAKNGWVWKLGGWVKIIPENAPVLLYDRGNPCEAVTGGWTAEGWSYGGYGLETARLNEGDITLRGSYGTSGRACPVGTANRIKLDGFRAIHAELEVTSGGIVFLGLCSGQNVQETVCAETVQTEGTHTLTLETAGVRGEYQVILAAVGSQAAGTAPTARISRVWGDLTEGGYL
jgi:hypothetical protein